MPTGVSSNPAEMGKRAIKRPDNSEPHKKHKNTSETPTSSDKPPEAPLNPDQHSTMEDTQQLTTAKIHSIIGTHNSPAYHRNMAPPNNQNRIERNIAQNLYVSKDKAPFLVIMQQESINEITVSRNLIACSLIAGIIEIKKVASNRVRVICKDMDSANNIIKCQNLRSQHNINAYIPNEYVKAVGIVKDVPLDLTNNEIIEYLESDIPVEQIERMNFWDRNEMRAKPGTSIKITFRSTNIPQQIKLYYTIKKVEHFVPRPVVCNKCLRFGHIARACRSRETKCTNCSQTTHSTEDRSCNGSCEHCRKTCLTKCNHCTENANHRSNALICPIMKNEMKIKECMVKQKLPYAEAKNKVNVSTSNTTYASVTRLSEFNKQLLERLKATEDILKKICMSQQSLQTQNPSRSAPPTKDNNISHIITAHFEKYNIKIPTTNQPPPNNSPNTTSPPNEHGNRNIETRNTSSNNNNVSS